MTTLREAAQRALEALADARSVCLSVSMSRDRRIMRDGCTMFLQTQEWCEWLETEVGPAIKTVADELASALASEPQAEPVLINGLTEAETSACASVAGLVGQPGAVGRSEREAFEAWRNRDLLDAPVHTNGEEKQWRAWQARSSLTSQITPAPEVRPLMPAFIKECAASDELLRLLGLDATQCRTDGGAINLGRVRMLLSERQAAQPAAPGWESIETAPMDGTKILASGLNYGRPDEGRHIVAAMWINGGWWGDDGGSVDEGQGLETKLLYLTHWMPLPPPPAATQGAKT